MQYQHFELNYLRQTDLFYLKMLRDDLKKIKSKLRDFDPKGREGSEKNQKFSLLEKRENHLRGGGVNSKSPFLFGNFIGKFCIFFGTSCCVQSCTYGKFELSLQNNLQAVTKFD